MEYVYILRSDTYPNRLYVGISNFLDRRLNEHNSGKVSYTYKFRPWGIVYWEAFELRTDAFKREGQIKRWGRGKKEALIRGDFRELKRINRGMDLGERRS